MVVFFTLVAVSRSYPPGALSGHDLISTFEVGSVLYNVSSILSGLLGIANAIIGAYRYFGEAPIAVHDELYLLVQAIAWITIAISLRIRSELQSFLNPTN